MKVRIITTSDNIVVILAQLLVNTNFNDYYYYSLYKYENDKYVLIIEDTPNISGDLAELVSKLSDIKGISWKENYVIIPEYNLLMTNYIPNGDK